MSDRRVVVKLGIVLASVCVVVLLCTPARAATYTFVPGGANDWWVTSSNWDLPGIPNSPNDVAVFDASTNPGYSTNTHQGTPYTVQELRYNTSSTWRMHNNERDINLEGPGTSALVTQNGSGAITFDCDLKFTDTTTFTGTGTGDITVNGSIFTSQRNGFFGPGGLIKEGSYMLTVNPIIQHTGGTAVNDGILRLNKGGLPLGVGTGQFGSPHTVTVNNGGTLQLTNHWVMGDGVQNQVVVNEGGTLQFLNSDNYLSNITLTGGAITTSGGTRPWRTGNFGPGVITVNPSATTSTVAGSLCLVGTAAGPTTTFDVAGGGQVDVSSHIFDHPGFEGAMRLVKQGAGKLTLTSPTSSWTGGVTINGGEISVPALSDGTLVGPLGAALGYSPNLVFDGGGLEYTGGNKLWQRAMTMNAGGGTIDVTNAATTLTISPNFTSPGQDNIVGPGGLTKTGPGTLILGKANSYAGGTIVDQGTLQMGNSGALGSGAAVIDAGATLDAAGTNPANNITINGGTLYVANGASGQITLNNVAGNRVHANGNYRVLSGKITGAGGFAVGGINTPGVALSNPTNDFQGDVSIDGGAYLRLNADEVIPNTANVTVGGYLRLEGANRTETLNALNGGGNIFEVGAGNTTLRVGANNGSGTFSGNVGAWWDGGARSIALVKLGDGTQTLSGGLYHSGPTTVDGGTLRIAGGVAFPGAGSSGKFAAPHVLNVNGGATLQINGDWITGDGLVNQINVNGGTLQFLDSDNYMSNIALTGGAITTSGGTHPWRTGNFGPGLIAVNPSATSSTITGSLCFVGTAAAPTTTFDVADGAAANDLVVSATVYDHPGFEGQMALVKDGPGTMVFGAGWHNGYVVNTYSGPTVVNEGKLVIAAGTWSGGSEIGGRLIVNPGAEAVSTVNHMFGYWGKPVEINEGTLTMSGVGAYINGLTMTGGTVNGGLHNWGNVTVNTSPNTATFNGRLNLLNGIRVFNVADGSQDVDLLITGGIGDVSWWADGKAGIRKTGAGTMEIRGSSAVNDQTFVDAGTLLVNGPLSTTGMTVAGSAKLGGTGIINTEISGAGQVSPGGDPWPSGAAPGVLAAGSVNGGAGLGFAFEFTAPGSPDYGNPAASINDVLRLTDTSSPFGGTPLGAGNAVDVYLDVADLTVGEAYRGGIYTDRGSEFLGDVAGASYNFFIRADGLGPVAFEGDNYYPLSDYSVDWHFILSTVQDSADFGQGPIDGHVMQMTGAVPEPATLVLAAVALSSLAGYARRRRKRA